VHLETVVSKESKIILNVIPLDVEHEMEYSLCHGLETHICRGGGVRVGAWCGSRLVNVQFNIKLATSVTAGRG